MSSVQPREGGSRFFQLVPALVGLLGVLIGAAATSGITWLGDHNRAKADERGAERLVLAEVERNTDLLFNYQISYNPVTHKHLSHRPRLSDAAWRAERERLARSLSNGEWAWVATYYRDLADFQAQARDAASYIDKDEGCTLVSLNAWLYSKYKYTALRKSGRCTKPPPPPPIEAP